MEVIAHIETAPAETSPPAAKNMLNENHSPKKRVVFKIFPREKYMKEHLSEEDWKVFEQFPDAEQEASST